MKYTHKLGYMILGGLLMLIGMITATMFLPNLVAQQSDSQTGDDEHIATFKTIMCNKIMVVDRTGRPAVFLDAGNGGNAIFFSNKGTPTITLSTLNNAGRLYIHDKTGQPVVDLHTTDNGGTVVATAITGKAIAILGIDKNNKGFTKTK